LLLLLLLLLTGRRGDKFTLDFLETHRMLSNVKWVGKGEGMMVRGGPK